MSIHRRLSRSRPFNALPFAVTSKHILTAAHCVQDKGHPAPSDAEQEQFSVEFGRNDFTDKAELTDGRSSKVAEFVLHPNWDAASNFYDGDIAVGVLTNAVTFGRFFRPICLNERAIDQLHGKQGKVVGWGSTDEVSGLGWSSIAQEFEVKIVSNEECKDHSDWLTALTSGTAFCAGNISRSAACRGKFNYPDHFITNYKISPFQAIRVVPSSCWTT